MFPLTIHKIFKMLCVVSVADYAFMTVLCSCGPCHHFDSFSHGYNSSVYHKKVLTAVIKNIIFDSDLEQVTPGNS